MKKHSRFSASKSDIWLNCPGSVILSDKAPPEKSSSYADEGTLAHACLEEILKSKRPFITIDKLREKHGEEMISHVVTAFKYIISERENANHFLIEEKVNLNFINPEMFGTLDVAIVKLFDKLHIIDYKHGQGLAVDPEENTQLIYYALGIAHKYDYNFEEVVLTIIQPRAEHEKGPIRTWTMSIKDLRQWSKKFKTGVEKALDPVSKLEPGDHCRWCNAKPICPAISEKAMKDAQVVFSREKDLLVLPVANELKPQALSKTLKAIDKLEVWSKAVRDYAFSLLERGGKIEGFKLVQKRSIRKWVDEKEALKEAVENFGDKALTEPKLLSPAQMEKICDSSKWIAEHVSNESSGLTMVEAGDPRPAFNSIENAFSGK